MRSVLRENPTGLCVQVKCTAFLVCSRFVTMSFIDERFIGAAYPGLIQCNIRLALQLEMLNASLPCFQQLPLALLPLKSLFPNLCSPCFSCCISSHANASPSPFLPPANPVLVFLDLF